MSVDLLRRAAALMRERAEAATPGPWFTEDPSWSGFFHDGATSLGTTYPDESMNSRHGANADHIASWHPAVALAVADWLDDEALMTASGRVMAEAALIVARAYLSEVAS